MTNDLFTRAAPIVLAIDGDTYISPNINATTFGVQTGEPHGLITSVIGHTAWWTYTPLSDGTVSCDTANGGADTTATELCMFTGDSFADLTVPGAEYDCTSFFGSPWSQLVDVAVTAGTTYYIQVSSTDSSPHYVLTLTGPASADTGTAALADKLLFWAPVAEQALDATALAWGTVIRRSSADVAFRVHNNSATFTATGITLTLGDTGATATPSVAAQHLLSLDGQTFTASLNLGDLPPLATTAQLVLRRVTASAAQLGAYTFHLLATAASWE